MPYRDSWELRGPLAFYLFALGEWLFGPHTWGVRVLDVALLLAGMTSLGLMVARLTLNPFWGCWAAVAYALWVGSLGWFFSCQPDGWVANLLLLGLGPLVARRPGLPQLLFCGAMVGCAGLMKPFYFAFGAVPLVQIMGQNRPFIWSKVVQAASLGVMALAPPLVALAWFAYRGALRDLVDVHLLYTMQVYANEARWPRIWNALDGVLSYFLTGKVALALPVVVIGLRSLWRDSRGPAVLLLTWFLVALACVAAQGKFFVYHWIPLFPPLLTFGVLGFHSLLLNSAAGAEGGPTESTRLLRTLALSLGALIVLQLAVTPASAVARWLKLMTGRIDRGEYYSALEYARYYPWDDMRAARFIRERTGPDDTVVVWGNNALINFLSGRANCTRFGFATPLRAGGPGSPRAAYRREFLTEIRKKQPAYVVVGLPRVTEDNEPVLRDFPEFETLLHERYSLETQIGMLDLYRRNN
jgi:hypothetical protein